MLSFIGLIAAEAAPLAPIKSWELRAEETHCLLLRDFSRDGEHVSLGFQPFADGEMFDLILVSKATGGKVVSGTAQVRFGTREQSLDAQYVAAPTKDQIQQVVRLRVPATALDEMLAGSTLTITIGSRTWAMKMPDDGKARAALSGCQADLLEEWAGKTEVLPQERAARASVAQLQSIFGNPANYPKAARKAGIDGKVSVMLVLSPAGQVEQCWDLTGASPLLTAPTCDLSRYLRFRPATDTAGKAIASTFKLTFTWVL